MRNFGHGRQSGQFGDEDGIRVTNVDLIRDPEDFVLNGGRIEQGASFGLSLGRIGAKLGGNRGRFGTSAGESGLLKEDQDWPRRSWKGDENAGRG